MFVLWPVIVCVMAMVRFGVKNPIGHVYSEGWAPRSEAFMEAVAKQARTTRHPWLVACDACMNPDNIKKSLWFNNRCIFIEAPGVGTSTCRSISPNGETTERTNHYVIASESLRGNN